MSSICVNLRRSIWKSRLKSLNLPNPRAFTGSLFFGTLDTRVPFVFSAVQYLMSRSCTKPLLKQSEIAIELRLEMSNGKYLKIFLMLFLSFQSIRFVSTRVFHLNREFRVELNTSVLECFDICSYISSISVFNCWQRACVLLFSPSHQSVTHIWSGCSGRLPSVVRRSARRQQSIVSCSDQFSVISEYWNLPPWMCSQLPFTYMLSFS